MRFANKLGGDILYGTRTASHKARCRSNGLGRAGTRLQIQRIDRKRVVCFKRDQDATGVHNYNNAFLFALNKHVKISEKILEGRIK